MKKLGILALIWIAALPLAAGEKEKELAEANRLEDRAALLLDRGRRTEAIDLLAKAAALREQARRQAHPQETPRAVASKSSLDKAFSRFDKAVASGDMAAAAGEARLLRRALAAWEKRLSARENRLAEREQARDIEARLDRMEHRLDQVRELLAHR